MSSPLIHKLSSSPILNIVNSSPYKKNKLRTILEQQAYYSKNLFLSRNNPLLENQNNTLNLQNKVLNDKIRNYVEENSKFFVQNSRLKQQNQILINKAYVTNTMEVDKINRELMLRDAEAQKLRTDIQLLRANYDRNIDHYILQNQSLKTQLQTLEHQHHIQSQQFKQKYLSMNQEDLNIYNKNFQKDITRLINNYQSNKILLTQTQLQIKHLTLHSQNVMKQYNQNLEKLISENNVLRNYILQIQIKKDNQIKQAQSMKQLEKSRTNGIITYCKENTAFMEKQVSKLAEQLLQKSISIEQFTKDMLKIKRNLEQTQRKYEDRIVKMQKDCNDRIKQIQLLMQKQQKQNKQQVAQLKKKQLQLLQIITTKQYEYQTLQKQNQHHKQIIKQKQQDIQNCKLNIDKLHEQHAKQMNKVMTDSRSKRKSMKNLSELSSSLKDLSVSGGSQIVKKTSIAHDGVQEGQNRHLSTVQQQMTASHFVPNEAEQQQDISLKQLVIHYQNMIQELKNNKVLEVDILNKTIQKLNQTLRQKQQQILEILQRFSPLMEYKISSNLIENQRKQKIQKHYLANLDLLSVLLDKYRIAMFSKKQNLE